MSEYLGIVASQLARPRLHEPPVPLDVRRGVFITASPERVWEGLMRRQPDSTPGGAALDATDVVVVPIPVDLHTSDGATSWQAVFWRRDNARLRAGLAAVVDVEPERRLVARNASDQVPLTLTTTLTPADGGCLLDQHLAINGAPDAMERMARFSGVWLERTIHRVKSWCEDGAPSPAADAALRRELDKIDLQDALGATPVEVRSAVDIPAPTDSVWRLVSDPWCADSLAGSSGGAGSTSRLSVASKLGELLVSTVRDGKGLGVSAATFIADPVRMRTVERQLTTPMELAVETTVAAGTAVCRVETTLMAWLPHGGAPTWMHGHLTTLLEERLAGLAREAAAGLMPARDPHSGYGPPVAAPPAGEPTRPDPALPASSAADGVASAAAPVPASVLPPPLLPPEVPIEPTPYTFRDVRRALAMPDPDYAVRLVIGLAGG